MLLSFLSIVLVTVLHSIFCQQSGKHTDENRPYKFGFNIDVYQHRQEEKNEKGIIKGEYGFITADGYYRVTKYETDENGKFRIISMKNYYVGFPPENPTTLPPVTFPRNIPPQKLKKLSKPKVHPENTPKKNRKTNFNPFQLTTAVHVISTTTKPTVPITYKQTTKRPISFQGQAGCSHCIIPTTKGPSTSDPRKYSVDYRVDLNFVQASSENPEQISKPERQNLSEKPASIKNEPKKLNRKNNNFSDLYNDIANKEEKNRNRPDFKNHISTEKFALRKDQPKENDFTSFNNGTKNNEDKNSSRPVDFNIHTFPKVEKDANVYRLPLSFNNGTIKNSHQQLNNLSNIVNNTSLGNNTLFLPPSNNLENFKRGPNPNLDSKSELDRTGKSNNDQDVKNGLLYTFNYTVDFHGHHEDGYKNGEKEGDYFVGTKDGVQRKVNYLANEFGYQPNITLVDLNKNDKSKINESNDKHTGLKGYEFKWFYRK